MRSPNPVVPKELEAILEIKTPRGTVRRYRVTLDEHSRDLRDGTVYLKLLEMDLVHYEEVIG